MNSVARFYGGPGRTRPVSGSGRGSGTGPERGGVWAQFLRKSAPTEPAKSRKCVEIYNADILFPTGITNVANNCYISAVMQAQCLFNHPRMTSISLTYSLQGSANHPSHCTCNSACTSGKLNKVIVISYAFCCFSYAWPH